MGCNSSKTRVQDSSFIEKDAIKAMEMEEKRKEEEREKERREREEEEERERERERERMEREAPLTPRGKKELLALRAEVRRLRVARRAVQPEAKGTVKYYFVLADKLRESTETTLPALQTLLANPSTRDWIVAKEMSFESACRGKYATEYLAVSHRWLTDGTPNPRSAHPDPEGKQLAAIKKHLMECPEIKYLWLDWLCMWQGGKDGQRDISVDEIREFKKMLREINMLYLGCKVLVLLDMSYLSRFWTMYEAWLSRLRPTAQGLELADGDAANRCHIVPILAASHGFRKALEAQIAARMASPEAAAVYLKQDDVTVTNASDKDQQLAKVSGLESRVRDTMVKDLSMARVDQAVLADPFDAAALDAAVAQAKLVGVANELLADALRVLAVCARGPAPAGRADVLRGVLPLLEEDIEEQRRSLLASMLKGGVSAKVARAAGYGLEELMAAGCVAGLKAAGYSCAEARAAGLVPSQAARAGYRAEEAAEAGLFKTAEEAAAAHCKHSSFTCGHAVGLSWTLQQMREDGFTLLEIKEAAGTTREQAEAAGFTQGELQEAGLALPDGVPAKEAIDVKTEPADELWVPDAHPGYAQEFTGTAPLFEKPELEMLTREASFLRLPCRTARRAAPRVKYYFVVADRLRETTMTVLPALQNLLDDPATQDWIVTKEMNFDSACRGEYAEEFLTVSHRWLTDGNPNPWRAHPDPKGIQLAAIKAHLVACPEIKYLWLDWPCMWQENKEGQRDITADERAEFKRMLGEINMLYLGCQVLVLLDLSYLSRFWTMYEAWLSRLRPTTEGLQLAEEVAARCHIAPILGASEGFKEALTIQIADQMSTPQNAAVYLKNPDVTVTNQGDKVMQLAKVEGLSDRVCGVLSADAATARLKEAFYAEPVDTAALGSAVARAAAAGVSAERLEGARQALEAAGDRPSQECRAVLLREGQRLRGQLREQRGALLATLVREGVGAPAARAMGYQLDELKAVGYVAGLKAACFSCSEVVDAGFLAREVAQAGYPWEEVRAAGLLRTIAEAQEAGYVENLWAGGFSGLRQAGFSAGEAKEGSIAVEEARASGYSVQELKEGGYSMEELRRNVRSAGYKIEELREGGWSLSELKRASYSAAEMRSAGCSAAELKGADYSNKQLRESYPVGELREAGLSLSELRLAGCTGRDLREAGCTAEDCLEGGYSAKEARDGGYDAKEVLEGGYEVEKLRAGGYTAKDLRSAGVSASDAREAKYPVKELWEAKFSVEDLQEAGYQLAEMRGGGATAAEARKAGYDLEDIMRAGYCVDDFRKAGYSFKELREAGVSVGACRECGWQLRDLYHVYTLGELKQGGFRLSELEGYKRHKARELKDAGFVANEVQQYILADEMYPTYSLRELRLATINPRPLFERGVISDLREYRKAGFAVFVMRDCGMSYHDLLSAGYTEQECAGMRRPSWDKFKQEKGL